MQLAEWNLSDFADLLASDAPAPGGGSAAALEGVLGAALAGMVCALTVGKEKYAGCQTLANAALRSAQAFRTRFLALMEEDAASFQAFRAALRMPQDSGEEKTARAAAVQAALERCTQAPLDVMELAAETLDLTASLLGNSNGNAVSDLGVSALSLRAAIQSAWLNVLVNTGSLSNAERATDYRKQGEALLARALPLADQIYDAVVGAI